MGRISGRPAFKRINLNEDRMKVWKVGGRENKYLKEEEADNKGSELGCPDPSGTIRCQMPRPGTYRLMPDLIRCNSSSRRRADYRI